MEVSARCLRIKVLPLIGTPHHFYPSIKIIPSTFDLVNKYSKDYLVDLSTRHLGNCLLAFA